MSDASAPDTLDAFLTARGYTAVPLLCNALGHFEVAAARLNDGVPVRLLLDTGASHTVVDRASAARLGLATDATTRRGGGVGGTDQVLTTVRLTHLTLLGEPRRDAATATIDVTDHVAYVMDLAHVSTALVSQGGSPIDGALGGDLLRPAEAVIDYARSTLYLRLPPLEPSRGAA